MFSKFIIRGRTAEDGQATQLLEAGKEPMALGADGGQRLIRCRKRRKHQGGKFSAWTPGSTGTLKNSQLLLILFHSVSRN